MERGGGWGLNSIWWGSSALSSNVFTVYGAVYWSLGRGYFGVSNVALVKTCQYNLQSNSKYPCVKCRQLFILCDILIKALEGDLVTNKANFRDLITTTGLVFLIAFVQIGNFLSPCDLEIGWLRKRIGHLFYTTSMCIISNPLVNSSWRYNPETPNLGENWRFFPVWPWTNDLGRMTLKNNRAPLPYYYYICAPFQSHQWIRTGVIVRKPSIRIKTGDIFVPCDLEIWQIWRIWQTSKNNRALLLSNIKLCASFHRLMWI